MSTSWDVNRPGKQRVSTRMYVWRMRASKQAEAGIYSEQWDFNTKLPIVSLLSISLLNSQETEQTANSTYEYTSPNQRWPTWWSNRRTDGRWYCSNAMTACAPCSSNSNRSVRHGLCQSRVQSRYLCWIPASLVPSTSRMGGRWSIPTIGKKLASICCRLFGIGDRVVEKKKPFKERPSLTFFMSVVVMGGMDWLSP